MLIGIIAVNYRIQYNNQEKRLSVDLHKHRQLKISFELLHSKGLPYS
jgi:hypothetical protein